MKRNVFLKLVTVILCTLPWSTATAATLAAKSAKPLQILALGDSLTAGYGLADLKDSFPAQLERALIAKGYDVKIVPGGISGETTTGGLNRLEWSLAAQPDAVIVELGANDALRGVDPKLTEDNLRAIVRRIQRDGIPVLLAGMLAPPNLGRDYGDRFKAIYPTIAKESGILLYPFFLDGVAAKPELNQADQMHPTPAGVAVIVKGILPSVEKLIARAERAARAKIPPS
jgi:acyl-CoA thioesterase-1